VPQLLRWDGACCKIAEGKEVGLIIQVHPETPQADRIKRAVEILAEDGVIVYPTDTVYGIGCSIYPKKGIERIRRIKGRDGAKHFSILSADLKDLSRYARNVSNNAYKLMRKMLPGPYTVVLQASREIPRLMQSKKKTIGIRVTENSICQSIVEELGHPIVTTSANPSGQELVGNPYLIDDWCGNLVDLIIDGGDLDSVPSTVIDLNEEPPMILREGSDPFGILELL